MAEVVVATGGIEGFVSAPQLVAIAAGGEPEAYPTALVLRGEFQQSFRCMNSSAKRAAFDAVDSRTVEIASATSL